MIEVEIKVRISDPDNLRQKFSEQNGQYKMYLKHEDTYFNMPKGLRDFRKTDEALRIRKSIECDLEYDSKEETINYFLTYKGKKLDGSTKSRKELEVKISKGEPFIEILELLGFRKIFTVIKERELYEFKYNNRIIEALIDYIPILKEYFMEVELVTESVEDLKEARDLLFEFLSLFKINKEESIRKSYLELIAERFSHKFKK